MKCAGSAAAFVLSVCSAAALTPRSGGHLPAAKALVPGSGGHSPAAKAAAAGLRDSGAAEFLAREYLSLGARAGGPAAAEEGGAGGPRNKHNGTCMWCVAILFVSCCCFGGGAHSEKSSYIGSGVASLVPLCVLVYILGFTDILARFYRGGGEGLGWWCYLLCIWCAFQFVCGACMLACLAFGLGAAATQGVQAAFGESLEERYAAAVAHEQEWTPRRKIPNSRKIRCYGLKQQISEGNVTGSQPWAVYMEDRAKWDAWKENEGKPREQCMMEYMDELEKQKAEFGGEM